jgi:plastocyanin
LGACQEPEPPPPPSDPELRAELLIPDDVVIHRVDLSGRADLIRVIPTVTEAHPGDIVQFVVTDNRVHLVRFREDRIAGPRLEFLRATAQDRPPPLVERGARLVLTFEGAPEGSYYFEIEGNGTPVSGEIRVRAP